MPTESFYKLNDAKRQKILDAMKKEFSRVPFYEASVNRIVEDAGISKGSFWVYFESKEEAINYLIEDHIEKEIRKAKEIFIKNKGDLFTSYIEMYDYLAEGPIRKIERDLMVNIFENLIMNSDKCICKRTDKNIGEQIGKMVDTSKLDLVDDDDLMNLMKILNYIMRINLLDCITQKIPPELSRNRFIREIEILKKGVCKNND